MNDFKYFHNICQSLIHTDAIQFKPRFTSELNDIPLIHLKSTSKAIVTYAVHKLLYKNKPFNELKPSEENTIQFIQNNDILQFSVSNTDFKILIQVIKNIVQQTHPVNKRHVIILTFNEVIKPVNIHPAISLIKKYSTNCLFVLTNHVPIQISQMAANIRCTFKVKETLEYIKVPYTEQFKQIVCPMHLCSEIDGIHHNIDEFITKSINDIFKKKSYEHLKAFSYKILASGIPLHLFCRKLFISIYSITQKCNYISLIADFEYKVINSTKPIFLLETLLLNILEQ